MRTIVSIIFYVNYATFYVTIVLCDVLLSAVYVEFRGVVPKLESMELFNA